MQMLQRFKEYSYLLMHINGDIDTAQLFAELYKDNVSAVKRMLKQSKYPGMKVLQFAFDTDEENDYLLHNFTKNRSNNWQRYE